MNIDHFKKSVKLALKEKFSTTKYGDNDRIPNSYITTYTHSSPFIGTLPKNISIESIKSYREFPKLSQELLIELFSKIGVEYVPEICIYQLKNKHPIEIFRDFVLTFGISIENRLNQIEIIDANILNRIIFTLRKMDKFRKDKLFDSKGVYRLLAQHQFDKADILIEKLKK